MPIGSRGAGGCVGGGGPPPVALVELTPTSDDDAEGGGVPGGVGVAVRPAYVQSCLAVSMT